MGIKTPPFKHYSIWTTSRFWSFVRSALRQAFTRWPPKYKVLENSKRIVKDKRHKYEYKCSKCKKYYKRTEIEVDHIEPAGSLKDYNDLPTFVERLFVGEEGLRLLCKPCHRKITNENKK